VAGHSPACTWWMSVLCCERVANNGELREIPCFYMQLFLRVNCPNLRKNRRTHRRTDGRSLLPRTLPSLSLSFKRSLQIHGSSPTGQTHCIHHLHSLQVFSSDVNVKIQRGTTHTLPKTSGWKLKKAHLVGVYRWKWLNRL